MRNNLHFTIQQYLNGMLDPQAMHELEKEALEDQFLAEALEGYHTVKPTHANLSILQQQLQTRVARQRVEKTTVSLSASRLSIAAVAGLILILSSILFWMIAFEHDTTSQQRGSQLHQSELFEASSVDGNAAPVVGWQQYDRYVQSSLRQTEGAIDGKVVLNLTVSNNQVQSVRVVKGLTPAQNAEAIRIIQAGPAWKGSASGPVRVQVILSFNQ